MPETKTDDNVEVDAQPLPGTELEVDLEKAHTAPDVPQLTREQSYVSHHELHGAVSHHVEANAAQYERFSNPRKVVITCVLSICGLLAPISSTTILSAIPEVAAEFHSTGTIINLSNAMYLVFMGISPCFWGPLSQIYGRRWICVSSALLFFAFSVGTALAPNLPAFFVFRILTAFQGTSFLIIGTSCLGDIYAPIERGTALGWFLSGALVGPAFGPFIGGIIVTFRSWRAIFWLQSALGGLTTVLVFFLLPETIPSKRIDDFADVGRIQRFKKIVHLVNPLRVAILLFEYPNLIIVGAASSSLVWNMYSLLTPIRYVLNPRFNLTSPIQSGLFYIAPGIGYLVGSFFGGRWADHIVKKWIKKRGRRIPEDRLKSCLSSMGLVIPACIVVYGWSVDKRVGGIPLPVVAMFVQGVAQLFCFPSLNTYCLDVMQTKGRSAEVVAGNYMIRYLFAAAGSAVVLPAIEKIGVGWFSTISCGFLLFSTSMVILTTIYGERWRNHVDDKKRDRKLEKQRQTSTRHDTQA